MKRSTRQRRQRTCLTAWREIVKEKYRDDARSVDLGWMKGLQEAEIAFCTAHSGAGGCSRICPPSDASGPESRIRVGRAAVWSRPHRHCRRR